MPSLLAWLYFRYFWSIGRCLNLAQSSGVRSCRGSNGVYRIVHLRSITAYSNNTSAETRGGAEFKGDHEEVSLASSIRPVDLVLSVRSRRCRLSRSSKRKNDLFKNNSIYSPYTIQNITDMLTDPKGEMNEIRERIWASAIDDFKHPGRLSAGECRSRHSKPCNVSLGSSWRAYHHRHMDEDGPRLLHRDGWG